MATVATYVDTAFHNLGLSNVQLSAISDIFQNTSPNGIGAQFANVMAMNAGDPSANRILYSGLLNVNGTTEPALYVAQAFQDANPGYILIQDTPVGQFLTDNADSLGRSGAADIMGILEQQGIALAPDLVDRVEAAVQTVFWAGASDNFTTGITGNVEAIVGSPNGGVFDTIELQNIQVRLSSGSLGSVNGVAPDAFDLSDLGGLRSQIATSATVEVQQNLVDLGDSNFRWGDGPATPGLRATLSTFLQDAGDSVAAGESLGGVAGALEGFGVAGVAIGVLEGGIKAIRQVDAGDYSGAAKTVADTGAGIAGALAGAELLGAAGAEAGSAFGPVGAFVGGALGALGGAFIGGAAAQDLVNRIGAAIGNTLNQLAGALGSVLGATGAGPAFTQAANQLFHFAQNDPLVIDLAGNGLNLKPVTSGVSFDFSGNHAAQPVGWIGAGTGFLAVQGANGQITAANLFGPGQPDGFTALRALDSNGDGVIDASDPGFANLVVWQDLNGDGVVEPGEVTSLAALGVKSISLTTTVANQNINGDEVTQTAVVTMNDGTTREIADVDFAESGGPTAYSGNGSVSSAAAALPDLQGYGGLINLRPAMTQDSQLLTMVQNLVASDPSNTASFDSALQQVLFRWAGVDGVSPTSRGPNFDAQKLGFLEDFLGATWGGAPNAGPAYVHQGDYLIKAFDSVFDGLKARFLVQDPNSPLFGIFSLDAHNAIQPNTDVATALQAVAAAAPSDPQASTAFWMDALVVINDMAANVAAPSPYLASFLSAALQAIAPVQFSAGVLSAAANGALTYIDTSVVGEAISGSPLIYGTNSADLFYVGAPAAGAAPSQMEIAQFDPGGQAENMLVFGAGISEQNLSVTGDANGDLILTYDAAGDQVKLDGGQSGAGVGSVVFSDGAFFTQQALVALATTGSPTKTKLFGGAEAETFDPKGFATFIHGGGGADTFRYNAGYGHVEISEDNGYTLASTANLTFGPGIAASNLSVSSDAWGDAIITDGTAGDQIVIDGELAVGPFGNPEFGVAQINFADGSSLTRQQLINLATTGTPTNTKLYGTGGADTFDSKGFATYEQGNGGADTFVYNPGYGQLEINEWNGTFGASVATLQFGAGVTAANLIATTDAQGDLTLRDGVAGDAIKLDNELDETAFGFQDFGVNQIAFADGSTMSRQQLILLADTGSASNTRLYGTASADTFDSKGFATYEQGDGGADTFLYNPGYGALEINENNGGAASTATLQFGAGITAAQLGVMNDGAGDLLLTDGTSGDNIKLDAELFATQGVAQVAFADGTSLTRAQLITLASTGSPTNTKLFGGPEADTFDPKGYATFIQGGGGPDTVLYNTGYGAVEFSEDNSKNNASTATLQFGAGITAANLAVSADASGNMFITDGAAGDKITLDAELAVGIFGFAEYGVAQATFADGSSLTRQHLIALADTGSATNTKLYGTGGADTFDSKGFATYEQGNGGADAFVYNSGYGALEINENNGTQATTATLQFGAGISAAQLSASVDAAGDLIITDGTTGDAIKLDNGLAFNQGVAGATFADGTTLTRQQLINLNTTGAPGKTRLIGTAGPEVFDSRGYSTYEQGNGGADTFVYNAGYGALEINEDNGKNNASTATLQFGAGITAANLTVSADASGNVFITDGTTGDKITLDGEVAAGLFDLPEFGVAQVKFADGSSLTRQQLINLALTGSAANTKLYGSIGADTFDSKGFASYEQGNGGADTFVYNAGYGALEINDDNGKNSAAAATLKFGAGVTAANLTVTADSAGNMFISDGTSGDSIKLDAELAVGVFGNPEFGVGKATFADGTTLTRQQLINLALIGSPTNTRLYGSSGADVFDSRGFATYEQGNGGADVFDYNQGYGALEINEANGAAVLQMGPGITAASITVASDANGDFIITDGIAGDRIVLDNALVSAADGVTAIDFADGTSLTRTQMAALALQGSPTNTQLYGTNGADVFTSNGYATYEQGNGGADTFLYQPGWGHLTINEDAGFWGPASAAVLQLAGITSSQVTLMSDTGGDVIVTDGVAGDRIVLQNMLNSAWGRFGVGSIAFADGTSWSFSQVVASLQASKGGLLLARGSGSRTFDEAGLAGNQALNLGASIPASDVLLQADNAGDLTVVLKDTGDSVTFQHDLAKQFFGVTSVLSQLTFADGTAQQVGQTWINQPPLTFTWVGSASATSFTGSNFGNNVFYLAPGGDSIVGGNASQGGPGLNTFMFAAGDGASSVNLNGGAGVIDMAPGITASDVLLQADNAGDLTVVLKDTGDKITFQHDLAQQFFGVTSALGQISFADGTSEQVGQTWINQPPLTFTWVGSASATSFTGSNFGNNVFYLAPGGDSIVGGNASQGGPGLNTFMFAVGDGASSVNLNGGGGVIDMAPGITASDVVFQADAAGDLTVLLRNSGDSITFQHDLVQQFFGITSAIGTVTFADGTSEQVGQTWLFQPPLVQTWIGTNSNTTLTGSNWGTNVFDLGPGNDVVTGGNGANAINFDPSVGQATVNLNSFGGDTLAFGAAITDEDLWFAQNGNDLVIDEIGTNSQVTIKNWYTGAAHQLNQITAGGEKLDGQISQLVAAMATFSAANSSFNPATATQMPTDSGLQSAIAAAWHS